MSVLANRSMHSRALFPNPLDSFRFPRSSQSAAQGSSARPSKQRQAAKTYVIPLHLVTAISYRR